MRNNGEEPVVNSEELVARGHRMELQMQADSAVAALCGGAVLGVATMVKLGINGNILGISGIVNGISVVVAKPGPAEPYFWRFSFLVGFLIAGGVLRATAPEALQPFPASMSLIYTAGGGVLVGFGTSVGCGCTSGHGISGLTRFSPRSMVATISFMIAGFLAASLNGSSGFFAKAEPLPPPVELPWSLACSLALVVLAIGFIPVVSTLTRHHGENEGTTSPDHPARLATEVVVATLFGLGLGISGMGRPEQVLGFLDVGDGTWDPTLAFVMGSALAIAVPVYHLRLKSDSFTPLLNSKLDLPKKTKIDAQLIIGSILFGIGWGLTGACPGPALIGIFAPPIDGDHVWPLNRNGAFMGGMVGGTLVHKLIDYRILKQTRPDDPATEKKTGAVIPEGQTSAGP
eukprot:SAG11_NODE_2667_length_3114_cov_3.233167_4_plen_402_part_00